MKKSMVEILNKDLDYLLEFCNDTKSINSLESIKKIKEIKDYFNWMSKHYLEAIKHLETLSCLVRDLDTISEPLDIYLNLVGNFLDKE